MSIVFLPSITAMQYAVLDFIGQRKPLSNTRDYIKTLREMTDTNCYAIVKRLETDGLIRKIEVGYKKFDLELTGAGRTVRDSYPSHVQ